jgi:hypothetical protein
MACNKTLKWGLAFVAITLAVMVSLFGQSATTTPQQKSSHMPVVDKEEFSTIRDRMSAAKAGAKLSSQEKSDLLAFQRALKCLPPWHRKYENGQPHGAGHCLSGWCCVQ